MNLSFITKYKPAIILSLALTVFLASCKGTTTTPGPTDPTGPTDPGTKSWVVTTFAGIAGSLGSANTGTDDEGNPVVAKFNKPSGVAVDASGNVYVADTYNHTIRKITITTSEAGVVTATVSTLAGIAGSLGSANTGTDDEGNPVVAKFNYPHGVAVDSSGILYVADTHNNCIQKITSAGDVTTVTTFAGIAGSSGSENTGTDDEGNPVVAKFNRPKGVAVDASGNVYVADTDNHTIRKITPGKLVTTLAGEGSILGSHQDGTGTAARFDGPTGVAVDSSGNLYVADFNNLRIRKITPEPERKVTTLAGGTDGSNDGTGTEAQFNFPHAVAVDSSGNLYVADMFNNRIRKITPKKLVTTIAGGGDISVGDHQDGTGTAARFDVPSGVAVDLSSGILYVADTDNHCIRKIEYK